MKHTWLAFVLAALTLRAQTPDTNLTIRVLSREDCIRLALENNLEIKISRHDPDISRFQLDGAYGYYDPAFRFSGIRRFSTSGGGAYNPATGQPFFNNEVDSDAFQSGLNGLGPLGFNYDLYGNFVASSGTQSRFPFDSYDSRIGIALTQPLLKGFLIDEGRMTVEVNKKSLKISQLALVQKIMDVAQQVQNSYYELIAARENVKVQEKALELAQRLVEENKKRVQVGAMAPLDERQAESQSASAMAELLKAVRAMAGQENLLRNQVGGNYDEWRKIRPLPAEALIAVPETYNLSESWRKALEMRPSFLTAKLEVEKQGVMVRFQQNQLLPALDLVGGYGRNGLSSTTTNRVGSFGNSLDDITSGRFPQYNVGAVLTVPLGNRNQRNSLKAARANKLQLEDSLRKLHQDIMVEIDDAVGEAQSQFEQVTATREASKFAEEALDAGQKKLENGKITNFEVLGLQRDLTAARAAEIRALANYNKALTALYFSEGTLLERAKVKVEFK